jgi:hypothetical protein
MPATTMRNVLLSALLAIALAPGLLAQSKSGTLTGIVQDPEKMPLPGVGMTITNAETRETYKAITGETGEYKVSVPEGTYIVTAQLPGFKSTKLPGVMVKENESTKVEPMRLTLDRSNTVPVPYRPGVVPIPLAPVVPQSNRI